jgi:hypothetical protein
MKKYIDFLNEGLAYLEAQGAKIAAQIGQAKKHIADETTRLSAQDDPPGGGNGGGNGSGGDTPPGGPGVPQ